MLFQTFENFRKMMVFDCCGAFSGGFGRLPEMSSGFRVMNS